MATSPVTSPSDSSSNQEISKYWTMNQTANILVSSTIKEEKDLRQEVITEFQKVSVLFDAITTAIARENHPATAIKGEKATPNPTASLGLFDYQAIQNLMSKCGFFALMHEEDRTFTKSSSSVSIDVALITEIIGDFSGAGPVMKVAQNLVKTMGAKAKSFDVSEGTQKETTRIGHILFICEDCMGMPLINIQVISTSLDQLSWMASTPCSSANHETINMDYKMESYMFVDPSYIAQFSTDFKNTPAFTDLVGRLQNMIA